MRANTIKSLEGLLPHIGEWNSLAVAGAESVFQMPGWVLPWLQTWGDEVDLHCVIVENAGELVGLAPLSLRKRNGFRCLQFIGSPLNDYNAFLARPGLIEDVGHCVFEHLASEVGQWDMLEVFVVNDFRQAIGIACGATESGVRCRPLEAEPSPLLELPASWDAYCASLGREQRDYYRYLERRLMLRGGGQLFIHEGAGEIVSRIKDFNAQRLESWRFRGRLHELPSEIKGRQFSSFLRGISTRLPDSNGLSFSFIEKDGRMIASGLYFTAGRRMLKYMQAWDCSYAALSPGTILDWLMIKYAISQQFLVLDFGRGAEAYKFRFGATQHFMQNAIISPPRDGVLD